MSALASFAISGSLGDGLSSAADLWRSGLAGLLLAFLLSSLDRLTNRVVLLLGLLWVAATVAWCSLTPLRTSLLEAVGPGFFWHRVGASALPLLGSLAVLFARRVRWTARILDLVNLGPNPPSAELSARNPD